MNESNAGIRLRHVICAGLLTIIGSAGTREASAQTESFPVEGGGGSSVRCLTDGAIQRTGKPFGSSPTTVTGCVLAQDSPYGLAGLGVSVYCKGGAPIQFDPGTGKLQSCTLAYDTTLQGDGNAPVPCKTGLRAEFGADGRLIACNGPPSSATANGGLFRPVSPQAAGNIPAAQQSSLFSYASPATPTDIAGYAQRSREFVESALDGDYARALRLSSDRFRREIGEKGLADFRDFVSKQGPAQFIAQTAFEDNGYTVVVGALALPNRRTMVVHVLFLNGQVEHLFERWGRR